MVSIDKEIMIKAPVEKIFNFVIKSSNLVQLWPSLLEVNNEKLLPNDGYSARWVYKMAGIIFRGKSECTDVAPYRWISVKCEGTVDSTMTWTFRSKDNISTKVTVTLDYQVHMPLLNRLAENIIIKMNDRESELVLGNLREFLEKN